MVLLLCYFARIIVGKPGISRGFTVMPIDSVHPFDLCGTRKDSISIAKIWGLGCPNNLMGLVCEDTSIIKHLDEFIAQSCEIATLYPS